VADRVGVVHPQTSRLSGLSAVELALVAGVAEPDPRPRTGRSLNVLINEDHAETIQIQARSEIRIARESVAT
jgi:hypothetical protein